MNKRISDAIKTFERYLERNNWVQPVIKSLSNNMQATLDGTTLKITRTNGSLVSEVKFLKAGEVRRTLAQILAKARSEEEASSIKCSGPNCPLFAEQGKKKATPQLHSK